MKDIKDELQNIILGDEPFGNPDQLKEIQVFLRRHEETSSTAKKQQRHKSEETAALIAFAQKQDLFYKHEIKEEDFISAGAEQRVYRLDGEFVIKSNSGIFYEFWLDYFNSLRFIIIFFLLLPINSWDLKL